MEWDGFVLTIPLFSVPNFSMYCASKWAVEGLTESISHELKPEWGIKVQCVEPGGFRYILFNHLALHLSGRGFDIMCSQDGLVWSFHGLCRKTPSSLRPSWCEEKGRRTTYDTSWWSYQRCQSHVWTSHHEGPAAESCARVRCLQGTSHGPFELGSRWRICADSI